MSPLSTIKYMVEQLEGTAYEPWVNALLFMLFAAAMLAAILFLLGRGGRRSLSVAISAAAQKLSNRRGYAPAWERIRLRLAPYVDFCGSLYFAFVGLYSATLVGLTASLGMRKAPFWALGICAVWVLASLFYMRVNLEAASWAYHEIKSRRG